MGKGKRRHHDTIVRMVKEALAEAAMYINLNIHDLLYFLNTDKGVQEKLERDGYLLLQLNPRQMLGKRDKVKSFYDRLKKNGFKYIDIKLLVRKDELTKKIVPKVMDVDITEHSGDDKTGFKLPDAGAENMTDAEMLKQIMRGLAYTRKPNRKEHPYLVEEDDLFMNDTGTFNQEMSKLENPLRHLYDDYEDNRAEGITTPMRYVGTEFTLFPLHVEDLQGVFSYNEVIWGAFKVWIIIKKEHFETLVIRLRAYLQKYRNPPGSPTSEDELTPDTGIKYCRILHKNLWVDPELLIDLGIPFRFVVQRASQAVITGLNSFHQGYNGGQNYAVAINLALNSYLDHVNLYNLDCKCSSEESGYVSLTEKEFKILVKIRKELVKSKNMPAISHQDEDQEIENLEVDAFVARLPFTSNHDEEDEGMQVNDTEESLPVVGQLAVAFNQEGKKATESRMNVDDGNDKIVFIGTQASLELVLSQIGKNSNNLSVIRKTPPKMVQCIECPKRIRSTDMARHLRQHGERGYQCDKCSSAFTTKDGLRQHQISHIQDKPYVCNDCGQRYKYPIGLWRHNKTIHKN